MIATTARLTFAFTAALTTRKVVSMARETVKHPVRSLLIGIPSAALSPLSVSRLIGEIKTRPLRSITLLTVALATLAIPGSTCVLAVIEAKTR